MTMELMEVVMSRIVFSLTIIIEICVAFVIVSAGLRQFWGLISKVLFQKSLKKNWDSTD